MNKMSQMITAWKKAAEDLEIEIQAPYILNVGNTEIHCHLLIKNFGSKKGTIILSTDDMDDFSKPAKLDYYCSALNPLTYSSYDRNHFIDTLNDWGFYGEMSKTPTWYTGQHWS